MEEGGGGGGKGVLVRKCMRAEEFGEKEVVSGWVVERGQW